jgi:hypothetical protein
MEDHAGCSDAELVRAVAGSDIGTLRDLHVRHTPWMPVRLARRCTQRRVVDEVPQSFLHERRPTPTGRLSPSSVTTAAPTR